MITKRQLGIGFIALGLMATIASFAIDFVGAGNFQGIGPAQKLALLGATVLVLVGLSLLPLGNRPA